MRNNFTNSILALLAFFLLILIQQKDKIKINNKQSITISETYIDLKEAKQAAEELDKNILVVFETDWCDICRKFKHDSISDIDFNEYVLCFLDIDRDKEFIKEYEIKSLPCYIILDKQGKVIKRGSGYKPKKTFMNWLYRSPQN